MDVDPFGRLRVRTTRRDGTTAHSRGWAAAADETLRRVFGQATARGVSLPRRLNVLLHPARPGARALLQLTAGRRAVGFLRERVARGGGMMALELELEGRVVAQAEAQLDEAGRMTIFIDDADGRRWAPLYFR